MKRVLFIAACSFFLTGIRAQPQAIPKFEAGIQIGIQSPGFLNDRAIDYLVPKDFRIRAVTGLFLRYYPTRHLFTEYELSFSAEGGGFKTRRTNLNFFRNELTIGLTSDPTRKNVWYGGITCNLNLLLSARSRDILSGTAGNIGEYYRRTYQGLGLSLGWKRPLGAADYLGFQLSSQLYSGNLNAVDHHTSRQVILPSLELRYSKTIDK